MFDPALEAFKEFFAEVFGVEVKRLPSHLMFDLCPEVPRIETFPIPQDPVDEGEGGLFQIYEINSFLLKDRLESFCEVKQLLQLKFVFRKDSYIQITQL
jgi:hypothetical protein